VYFPDKDEVFRNRVHYEIKKEKGGGSEECKVRCAVQREHMQRKNVQGIGDYDDVFRCVPAASSFWQILSLAT